MTIRRYYWTISITWYDREAGRQREIETHYTTAQSGPIRNNRRKLGLRSARFHQLMVYRKHKKLVPLSNAKVRFEREERASKVDSEISVDARSMWYKGKHWKAKQLRSSRIPLRASKIEREAWKVLGPIAEMREVRHKTKESRWKRINAVMREVDRAHGWA